jgi:hypothetical protein
MGVIPIDAARRAANKKPLTFWQRIAQLVDRHIVDRSRREVPAIALRRSNYDLNRCRRMLHDSALSPVARFDGASR